MGKSVDTEIGGVYIWQNTFILFRIFLKEIE